LRVLAIFSVYLYRQDAMKRQASATPPRPRAPAVGLEDVLPTLESDCVLILHELQARVEPRKDAEEGQEGRCEHSAEQL